MATAGDGEADERVRIITGDELGFLKVIDAASAAALGAASITQRWGEGDKASGVVRLAATPLTSQEHLLVVGRASGALDVLSTVDGALVATAALPGVGGGSDVTITGVGFVPSPGGPSSIIACTSDGHVITFKVEGAALEEASRWQVPLPVNPKKGSLDCLAVSPNGQEIATGGEGTELAMYNLETHEATFKVKPPKPDRLGMVPRPWISAVSYFPGEGSRKVICGTGSNLGKGRVLVYDAAVQRRALTTIEYGETKITSVAADAGGLHGYAATGAGDLSRFDLRAAKAEGAFKGPAGSVRALALHPSMPLIASAGLDRFARVHTTGTRKAVGKVYAKIPMTGVV
eukprot:CAMPEP_0182909830 /NCGR_PEP_ID=MMETSP0034_2-20130328/35967_1 /TAXON_ID=156128 /ORGANISM="Nephroselmis pyriformis, Strain CCMP717" /LENGTH=344 /DNA_ID=CAMNT_0025046109 /DNA_START=28 /DNA_END=1059 /DNA_ORIENTATION=-